MEEYTKFIDKLQQNKLHLISNDDACKNMNFTFIADDIFGLHKNVLKPFPDKNLSQEQRII